MSEEQIAFILSCAFSIQYELGYFFYYTYINIHAFILVCSFASLELCSSGIVIPVFHLVLFFSLKAFSLSFSPDPNALGQHGPDHALIGGVVAVVVFVTLCLIIVLGRYLARHKGEIPKIFMEFAQIITAFKLFMNN